MDFTSRDQIDERYKWDLSSMCASDEDFGRRLKKAGALPEKLISYQGKVSKSAEDLLAYLRLEDEVSVELERLCNYADRRGDEDTRVAKYQSFSAQAMALATKVQSATSWFNAELLAMPEDALEAFFAEKPELEHYRRKLEQVVRLRPHTLSAPEEKLLASAQDSAAQPGRVFSLLNDADLSFPDATDSAGAAHKVTHGSFIPLMMSHDRALRRSAFDSVYGSYGQVRNTSAALLSAQAKHLAFFADARRYASALELSLDANEIPVSVYENLLGAVHDGMPAAYRYFDLRRRTLGLDKLHFWDVYVPLVEDVDMSFTYEEACELIQEALAPLGDEYLSIVRHGLESRWIEVYETPGKASGAYSAGSYGMEPVILLNFQNNLESTFTLIHEMGHSVHTYLSAHAQGATYANYSIFVAEVASTFNEALLYRYLLEHESDPKRHAFILNQFAEGFRTTLYRQAMFAEFERDMGEICKRDGALTADALCERYGELCGEYFGPAVEVDDGIRLEWARIPHFYYNYYVYQYATSFAAAIALSQRVLDEGEPAVQDYLDFLRGGNSKPPIELLRGAGVDMSTSKPVEDALAYFAQLVDELGAALKA